MAIAAVLYTLLQVVLIGGLNPADIASGWTRPLGTDPSNYGAWYTLALAVGAGWLATLLMATAVISPAATGVVYMAATARLSYALGEEREMPSALARTNDRGLPVVSILVAAAVGTLALGPFKSWNALVAVVTGAVAIMYAFAPLSLAALHRVDAGRPRSYRVPVPKLLLPAAFCSANLIMYWGGFDTTWKLAVAMLAGLALFAIGAIRGNTGALKSIGSAIWIAPWLAGHVVIGYVGRYGGGRNILPDWIDLAVVIAFSLAIFYWGITLSLSKEQTASAVAKDAHQMAV
jgi:amino acid transporter